MTTQSRPTSPTDPTTQAATAPAVVLDCLAALAARDAGAALRTFTADAVVTDEGRTYRGTGEVREFLEEAGGGFSFTSELVGVRRVDDEHWVATTHLEGDFPGGVADLENRFTLTDGLVAELVIAPR